MVGNEIVTAAELLRDARKARRAFEGFPREIRPHDEARAYAVQTALHVALDDRGPVVGTKIGCTTPVMQAYLGIENPCAGGIFVETVFSNGAHVDLDRFVRAGVECEIAVVVARELPASEGPYGRSNVADAVEACCAAIEIVEDRYVDYRRLDAPTLIADDFFGAGCVLGPLVSQLDARELDSARASMRVNGADAGCGSGKDILGHPLEALAWLANHRARRGAPLQPGEIVLLGSMVKVVWVSRGDEVVVENDRLGTVRATFR